MTSIKWEEPPAIASRREGTGKWQRLAMELQERPGAWALVAENVNTSSAQLLKRYGLEVTMRGISADRKAGKVYARWPEVSNG